MGEDVVAITLEAVLVTDVVLDTTGWIMLQAGIAICPLDIIIGTPCIGVTVPVGIVFTPAVDVHGLICNGTVVGHT